MFLMNHASIKHSRTVTNTLIAANVNEIKRCRPGILGDTHDRVMNACAEYKFLREHIGSSIMHRLSRQIFTPIGHLGKPTAKQFVKATMQLVHGIMLLDCLFPPRRLVSSHIFPPPSACRRKLTKGNA